MTVKLLDLRREALVNIAKGSPFPRRVGDSAVRWH